MKYDIVKLMARRKIRWKKRWVSGDSGGRLTFRSKKAGRLSDYRIYGNTVGGESVGDLVESGEHAGEYKVPVTVEGKNIFSGFIRGIRLNTGTGIEESNNNSYTTDYLPVEANMLYTYSGGSDRISVALFAYDSLKKYIGRTTNEVRTTDIFWMSTNISGLYTTFRSNLTGNNNPIKYIRVTYVNAGDSPVNAENIMLNSGSTALPYEPYHAPVTTPIYLPEQIKKVGDEAEYIDYGEQKMHRIGADDIDVTLPALPTLPGTNVLSVGTAVQPSRVEVKGRIKAVGQETEPE